MSLKFKDVSCEEVAARYTGGDSPQVTRKESVLFFFFEKIETQ